MSTSSSACNLASLAGHKDIDRANHFASLYETALKSIAHEKALTPAEQEALAQNPFAFPDFESGRHEAKKLFVELGKAFGTIDEIHRAGALKRINSVIAHHGRASVDQARSREEARRTNPTRATPTGSLDHDGYFPELTVLSDGRRVLTQNGVQALAATPGTRFAGPAKYDRVALHPDEKSFLAWPVLVEQFANLKEPPIWVAVDEPNPPIEFPFDLARFPSPEGGRFAQYLFSRTGDFVTVGHEKELTLFSPSSQNAPMEIGRGKPLGFAPDGKSFWYKASTVGGQKVEVYRHDIASGLGKKVGPDFTDFVFGFEDGHATLIAPGSVGHGKGHHVHAIDVKTGEVTRKIEVPTTHYGPDLVLGGQPVWLRARNDEARNSFEIFLISKTTGKVRAAGLGTGHIYRVAASADGRHIQIGYQVTSTGEAHRLESFDIGEWLRLGEARTSAP